MEVFAVPRVSLPRRLEAMPCNEDHDVPHKPVANVEGVACDPRTSDSPFNLLFIRGDSKPLLDDRDREGCLLGMGEGALEFEDWGPSS